MLDQFLSTADADRALGTIWKLFRSDLSRWALTGGFAVEIHRMRQGERTSIRSLNDLDFVTGSFDCIPESLGKSFLFRHIHPLDPPGKTMLQLVDPDGRLRVDVFRAGYGVMDRATSLELAFGTVQLVSVEDLLARFTRLLLDLGEGVAVPAKHARDFWRLSELLEPAKVETAWLDHRKPNQPASYQAAHAEVRQLIAAHPDLLITPVHSQEPAEVCPRCAPTKAFRLADPRVVLSLLGYC